MKSKKMILTTIFLSIIIIGAIIFFIYSISDFTEDKFITKLESLNFSIVDTTEQYVDYAIASATTAYNDNYQIELLVFENIDECNNGFKQIKNDFNSIKKDNDLELDKNNEYSLTTSSKYMYVKKVEQKIIYFFVDSSYKNDLEKIMKELNFK